MNRILAASSVVGILAIALSSCFITGSPPSGSGATTFEPGQVWSYITRPGEESSTLIIQKIVKLDSWNTAVHIAIHEVSLKNPRGYSGVITEVPDLVISQRALSTSVVKLIRQGTVRPNFDTDYDVWKENWEKGRAGLSQATVANSLSQMEENLMSDGASSYGHEKIQHDLGIK